jgi:hypothetical protein
MHGRVTDMFRSPSTSNLSFVPRVVKADQSRRIGLPQLPEESPLSPKKDGVLE